VDKDNKRMEEEPCEKGAQKEELMVEEKKE
jgi:hypothetical protein